MLAAALALLARITGLLPLPLVRALGRALGAVAWAVGIRRAHVVRSMERAGVPRPRREARRMYRGLGMGVFELLWLRGRRAPIGELAHVDPASRDAFARARASGRGVVLAASHTGNWEIAACRLAEDGEVLAVTKRLAVGGFHRFCNDLRAARRVISACDGGVVWRARATLRRGGVVAMMLDQVPARRAHGVGAEFLGAPALVDRAPAQIAAATGAPLVVTAARRNLDGTHALEVLAVHEPPAEPDRAWVLRVSVEATRALEAFVRRHPSEWMWLHRRWAEPRG